MKASETIRSSGKPHPVTDVTVDRDVRNVA